jgi:hypothetical protein
MSRIIDADSHFMEPLDLWERYIEPKFRSRCLRFERDPQTGRYVMVLNENKRIKGVGEFTLEFSGGCFCGGGESGSDGRGVNRHTTTARPGRTSSPVMMSNGLRIRLSARLGLLYRVVLSQSIGVPNEGTTKVVVDTTERSS